MTEHPYAMIDALIDGERVDAGALTRALAEAEGREYLIDVLALRDAVAHTTPKVDPTSLSRPRAAWRRAIAWPAAAAVLVTSLASGFAAGYQFAGTPPDQEESADVRSKSVSVTEAPEPAAPAPTRVIRLESGVDWQEGTGGD